MTLLETMEEDCAAAGVAIERHPIPGQIEAVYYNDPSASPIIVLDDSIRTQAGMACRIAEELGHHYTTCGDILTNPNISKIVVRKAETVARRWAFKYAVSLSSIVDAWDAGARSLHDMAEHIGIEEPFLKEAIETYDVLFEDGAFYGIRHVRFNPVTVTHMKRIPILGVVDCTW